MHTPTLMAVHAHPDDECFGGGGTLAHYSAAGYKTVLVTCTNGEEGEIVDPDMDVAEIKPRLGDVRLGELNAAVGVLGVTHLELLGYRDSGMVDTPSNDDPRSFNKADPAEATRRLTRLIRKHQPDVIFTYAEDGGYGHPDHIMAHKITVAAFAAAGDPARYSEGDDPATANLWTPRKLYYCSWMVRSRAQGLWYALRDRGWPVAFGDPDATEPPERGTLDADITTWLDVRDVVSRKIDALRTHRTQIKRESTFLNLPDDLAREYVGVEGFRRAQSRVDAPEREDDLFAGIQTAVVSRESRVDS